MDEQPPPPVYSSVIKVYMFLTRQVNYSLIGTGSDAGEDTPCCTFLYVTPFSKHAVPGQPGNRVEKRGKNRTKERVV